MREFGAAVIDRPLSVREIRQIIHMENIVNAHRGYARAENGAAWAHANPALAAILAHAQKVSADAND